MCIFHFRPTYRPTIARKLPTIEIINSISQSVHQRPFLVYENHQIPPSVHQRPFLVYENHQIPVTLYRITRHGCDNQHKTSRVPTFLSIIPVFSVAVVGYQAVLEILRRCEAGFPAGTRDKRPPKAAANLFEGVRRLRSRRLKSRVGKQSESPKSQPRPSSAAMSRYRPIADDFGFGPWVVNSPAEGLSR